MATCICGAELAQHDGKGRPAQFCSTRCRVAAHRAKDTVTVTKVEQTVTKLPRQQRAPFPWFGGKQAIAPTISRLLPEHTVYVEVFGGAASLLWAKTPSRQEVYNDLDAGLVNFFRVLRGRGSELQELLQLTPYSRQEYIACRDTWQEAPDELEQARRWYIAIAQGFSSTSDLHTGWSYSRDVTNNPARAYHNMVQALPWFISRLASVQIEHLDFAALFAVWDTPETLFYCDPPYLPETRRSKGYKHEMTPEDHKRLLETITSVQGKIVLSGYRSALYDEALASWERIDLPTVNWSSNKLREARTECIWLSPNIQRQPSLWEVTA